MLPPLSNVLTRTVHSQLSDTEVIDPEPWGMGNIDLSTYRWTSCGGPTKENQKSYSWRKTMTLQSRPRETKNLALAEISATSTQE